MDYSRFFHRQVFVRLVGAQDKSQVGVCFPLTEPQGVK